MDQMLKMMNPDMLKSMNFDKLSPEDMKQAESIWKMLDDMSQNDQEVIFLVKGYKKFVEKNVQSGIKDLKEKQTAEFEKNKVNLEKHIVFKFFAKLQKVEKNEDNKVLKNLISTPCNSKTFPQDAKYYLNVCLSDKVSGPLNKEGCLLLDLRNPNQIDKIPYSLSNFQTKKSSLNNPIYFYDLCVNKQLIMDYPQLRKTVYDYLIKNFQQRIMTDRNPLIKELQNELFFYKLDIHTECHKKKLYKNIKNYPESQVLEQSASLEAIQEKKKKEIQTQLAEQQVQEIQLIKPEVTKKNLIQEIKEVQDSKKPPYSIKYLDSIIDVEILMPKVNKFSDIDLQISFKELKLEHKDYSLEIAFKEKVNQNNVQAAWDKKQKKLKLSIPFR